MRDVSRLRVPERRPAHPLRPASPATSPLKGEEHHPWRRLFRALSPPATGAPAISRDLTTGPVRGHLAALAGPMMLGIVAAMSVALVDAFFVGRLGTTELAAISFTFPVTFAVQALSIGLGAGTASVVSRAIGEGDIDEVRRLSTDSLVLAVLLVIGIAVLGWLTVEPLFRLLGASDDVMVHIVAYMKVWYVGMPFLVVPMVANNIIRANGDAVVPSAIMIAASVINAGLDPLLIFGLWGLPELGVAGAAWASVIARAATLVLSLAVVIFRERLLDLTIPPLNTLIASWRRILSIGLPASIGSAINPVCITVLTAIIASYSTAAVAGFGVATRIEAFAAIPMLAISSAIGPIAGQNWGRGERARVQSALRQSYAFCIAWGLVAAAILLVFGDAITSIFTDDGAAGAVSNAYLAIVPVSFAGYGIVTIAAGCYNALGKPLTGLGYYLVRSAALYVPLSWIASLFFPSWGVFVAIAVSNVAAGALVAFHSLRWLSGAEQGDCRPAGAMQPAE